MSLHLDIITIFPDYFAPLELSLLGKAQAQGLLSWSVHDLRQWTYDRHRTVDDTPYGGGAGMVMKPEPWGEALDAVVGPREGADGRAPSTLIVPTPSGEVFRQDTAYELAAREHLVFACGRYEGIDARVMEHARTRMDVREISLGDYVLNGGEVAVLAMVEAIGRLIPGVVGNPESLLEESHSLPGGGLEYPVYTKPARWRGLDVPEILFSGHHAKIAAWRAEQSRERTLARRPDLLAD